MRVAEVAPLIVEAVRPLRKRLQRTAQEGSRLRARVKQFTADGHGPYQFFSTAPNTTTPCGPAAPPDIILVNGFE